MPDLGVLPGGAPPAPEGFELVFADDDGEHRVGLDEVWSVSWESCRPVRGFPSFKGQRHYVGRWWTATTGTLVGFESWLERDRLILLDFDPQVVGVVSQPFWLFFITVEGKRRSHAPDYLARLADGSVLVLDCRPVDRIGPRDRVAFEATARACAVLGWRYEVVDAVEPVVMGNVRWLAGYRHPRHDLPGVAAALREVFAEPSGLLEGAGSVGDPIAVLPVLFHLLWRRELHVGLDAPLHTRALVSR